MTEARWRKTEAGRAEIRLRALPLPRPARTLLLILDRSKPADAWVALVNGASTDDLEHLAQQGLIEPAVEGQAGEITAPTPLPANPLDEVHAALAALDYDALYALMTRQVREHHGLIKGYRLALEIERCASLPELRALALRLADQWHDEQQLDGLRAALLKLG